MTSDAIPRMAGPLRPVDRSSPLPRVVITMPAYQAERTLERTVLAIPAGLADELILVDDASRDGTADLARKLGLQVHVHTANRGYGGNQKSCYQLALESGADIVVLLHPDYQYEPKAVPLLIAPILAGEADMTFGSRFAGLGDPLGGGMPRYRYLGNRITTTAQNLMLGTRFTDMHSGMRAYTRACLESLPFLRYSEGFAFDAELLVDAVTSGRRVVEVPIPTRYTEESSSISICGRSPTSGAASPSRQSARPFAVAGATATCRAGGDPRALRGEAARALRVRVVRQRAHAPALPRHDDRRRADRGVPMHDLGAGGPRRHPRVPALRAPLVAADPSTRRDRRAVRGGRRRGVPL